MRAGIIPGAWVRVVSAETQGWVGKVGRVDEALDNGRAWVRGLGWRCTFRLVDLEPCDRPDLEPWLTDDYATDVDGFLAAYAEDDNTFWRMDSGHTLNVLDALIERVDAARATAVRLEGELARVADLVRGMCHEPSTCGAYEGFACTCGLDDLGEALGLWERQWPHPDAEVGT